MCVYILIKRNILYASVWAEQKYFAGQAHTEEHFGFFFFFSGNAVITYKMQAEQKN